MASQRGLRLVPGTCRCCSGLQYSERLGASPNRRPLASGSQQDCRTRKDRSLKTVSEAGYVYPRRGTYTACVKVLDTFGCDTSITVKVTV